MKTPGSPVAPISIILCLVSITTVEIKLFSQNIWVRETPREIPVQHFFPD